MGLATSFLGGHRCLPGEEPGKPPARGEEAGGGARAAAAAGASAGAAASSGVSRGHRNSWPVGACPPPPGDSCHPAPAPGAVLSYRGAPAGGTGTGLCQGRPLRKAAASRRERELCRIRLELPALGGRQGTAGPEPCVSLGPGRGAGHADLPGAALAASLKRFVPGAMCLSSGKGDGCE